jgi:hypothetical protein
VPSQRSPTEIFSWLWSVFKNQSDLELLMSIGVLLDIIVFGNYSIGIENALALGGVVETSISFT